MGVHCIGTVVANGLRMRNDMPSHVRGEMELSSIKNSLAAGCNVALLFGLADERWTFIGKGRYHDRLNEYFHCGEMRGYRPLKQAIGGMELTLDRLHRNGSLVVAVTHDLNVAAFLAVRGVVLSFTEENWQGYLDAAIVVRRPDGHVEYGVFRWHKEIEGKCDSGKKGLA